jgi:hypothetical protein
MEEVLQILAERVRRFTCNESTSVTYDKARQLTSSILYCMKEEITYNTTKKKCVALSVDQKISASEAFKLGLARKKEKINEAKVLYQDILKTFCFYENRCYYDTIIKGMPAFFQKYDVEFDAVNHILTLDYPLLYDVKEESGIDLIYEYLYKTQLEQKFLNKFSNDILLEILDGYHEKHSELIINICGLVLRNAIGCMLTNKSIYELNINDGDRQILKIISDDKSLKELEQILSSALDKIIQEEFDNEKKLLEYLKHDIKEFAFEIKTYSDNNCLEKLFLGKREERVLSEVVFKDGISMEDELLRKLIDEMRESRFLSDKLILLMEQVRSLSDLKEILKECFFEGEYNKVFNLLSEGEVKILKDEVFDKKEFDEDLDGWENALLNF